MKQDIQVKVVSFLVSICAQVEEPVTRLRLVRVMMGGSQMIVVWNVLSLTVKFVEVTVHVLLHHQGQKLNVFALKEEREISVMKLQCIPQ